MGGSGGDVFLVAVAAAAALAAAVAAAPLWRQRWRRRWWRRWLRGWVAVAAAAEVAVAVVVRVVVAVAAVLLLAVTALEKTRSECCHTCLLQAYPNPREGLAAEKLAMEAILPQQPEQLGTAILQVMLLEQRRCIRPCLAL